MFETLLSMPLSFWVAVAILLTGFLFALEKIRCGIGLPLLAVLATAAVWYLVDMFYNGYEYYTQTFTSEILSNAWWQVALFLVVFLLLAPELHKVFNARYNNQASSAYFLAREGVNNPFLQQRLSLLFKLCFFIWGSLAVVATFRLHGDVIYYFFPFLFRKMDPWGRDRLGSGFDALFSLAFNLQIFATAGFGISAALVTNTRIRAVAIAACCVAMPYFVFDRTRNVMLSSMLPGILSWVIFRIRGSVIKKGLILAFFFFVTNVWFGFVIANRTNMTIAQALQQKGLDISADTNVHHEGLNMFEELCWINTLTGNGSFRPPWGEMYFDELVSPIPRALWPGKPAENLVYSIARGQAGADFGQGGTMCTGMIGQGVASFGPILGPAFAAFLMSVWAVILARLDLRGRDLVLYGFGLILTFNLGRDITTITLYTFIFGSLAVWCMNRISQRPQTPQLPHPTSLCRHMTPNV